MSNRSNSQYFAALATIERRRSMAALDPQYAFARAEMAARFESLAMAFETEIPRLRMAIH